MPEIGETLREARMRAKIDVSEVEAETKIRAKYLRALENEEWDLLPGPTFARSFLRTYADYLGLDSKLLVEEFKLRHEGPKDFDLTPIAPSPATATRRRFRAPTPSRGWVIALSLFGLLALLVVLGSIGSDRDEETPGVADQTTQTQRQGTTPRRPAPAAPAAPAQARLKLTATSEVYVCLEGDRGRLLIDGRTLLPGDSTRTFRARRFRVTLGNGEVNMRVNGRVMDVPDESPIAFEITPRGRRQIPETRAPTCL
jgi:cytoskeletal protein RodZ